MFLEQTDLGKRRQEGLWPGSKELPLEVGYEIASKVFVCLVYFFPSIAP